MLFAQIYKVSFICHFHFSKTIKAEVINILIYNVKALADTFVTYDFTQTTFRFALPWPALTTFIVLISYSVCLENSL